MGIQTEIMLTIIFALAASLWLVSSLNLLSCQSPAKRKAKLNRRRKSLRLLCVIEFLLITQLFLFESNFLAIREFLYAHLSENLISAIRFLLFLTLGSRSVVYSLYVAAFFAIMLFASFASVNFILSLSDGASLVLVRRNNFVGTLSEQKPQKQAYKPVIRGSCLYMMSLRLRI